LTKTVPQFNRKGSKDKASSKHGPVRFHDSLGVQDPVSAKGDKKNPLPRFDTFGSIKDRKMEDKLKREERKIECDVKLKLDNIYGKGKGQDLYYRLAPERSPQGTALNDSAASRVCVSAAKDYTSGHRVEIFEIARRVSESDAPTTAEITDEGAYRPPRLTAATVTAAEG
jgi:hypothetical protein